MITIFNICQSPECALTILFFFSYDPLFLNRFCFPETNLFSPVVIMNAMNALNRYDLYVLEDGEKPCVLNS